MKQCFECGYTEHWGPQTELSCPNCEERLLVIEDDLNFEHLKSACINASMLADINNSMLANLETLFRQGRDF